MQHRDKVLPIGVHPLFEARNGRLANGGLGASIEVTVNGKRSQLALKSRDEAVDAERPGGDGQQAFFIGYIVGWADEGFILLVKNDSLAGAAVQKLEGFWLISLHTSRMRYASYTTNFEQGHR